MKSVAQSRRFLTGLLGAPIASSAAPAMHERAAEALDLRCHYQLIEVAGATREELKLLLEGVRRLGFAGINVTYPYKEAVVDLLDELSPGAAQIGAVNTVVVRDGRLTGHNTDTTGFARAVSPLVSASGYGTVAVIGAGGVGKAIGFALAGLGVKGLRIFDSEAAKVMTGRELAIYSAADAFELFTGFVPSTAEMGIAFDEVMAKRYAASHVA
jgi:shikimate dehydrogenase